MLVPNPVFHPAGCVNYFIYRQNQTQDSTRINRLKPEVLVPILLNPLNLVLVFLCGIKKTKYKIQQELTD